MIHCTAHEPFLPLRMVHLAQLPELCPYLVWSPSFLRQVQIPADSWTRGNKLALELRYRLGDLPLDRCADTGSPEEDAVESAAYGDVCVDEGADWTTAFELEEGLARPAENE